MNIDPDLSTSHGDFDSYIGFCDSPKFMYIDDYLRKLFILQKIYELDFDKGYSLRRFKESTDNLKNQTCLYLDLTE